MGDCIQGEFDFKDNPDDSANFLSEPIYYERCSNCNDPFSVCYECKKEFNEGDIYYCIDKKEHYCKSCAEGSNEKE